MTCFAISDAAILCVLSVATSLSIGKLCFKIALTKFSAVVFTFCLTKRAHACSMDDIWRRRQYHRPP